MTYLVWWCWLDQLGGALYDFMGELGWLDDTRYYDAMNRGFDLSERFYGACQELAYWDNL